MSVELCRESEQNVLSPDATLVRLPSEQFWRRSEEQLKCHMEWPCCTVRSRCPKFGTAQVLRGLNPAPDVRNQNPPKTFGPKAQLAVPP